MKRWNLHEYPDVWDPTGLPRLVGVFEVDDEDYDYRPQRYKEARALVLRCTGLGMKYLAPLLCLALMGCIHRPTTRLGVAPGAPAPTQAQITSCEKMRTAHNAWTIAGAVFGGAAGAEGAADGVTTNKTAQTGISIGVAVSGVLALVSTTVAGMEASDYATSNCNAVLSAGNYTP